MNKLVIRFANEWYIQDGFTDLRSQIGAHLENHPKFIKSTLDEIKQIKEDMQYMQLKSHCTMDEIGFVVERKNSSEFGEKTYYYGINTKENYKSENEKMLSSVAKIFADNFKQYVEQNKKIKPGRKAKCT